MWQNCSILGGKVNFPLCLAPMVGISNVAVRRVIRDYLPENYQTIWPTEMLNSRRLPKEDLAKTPETLRESDEDFLVPQILCNEEDPIRQSLKILKEWGASAVDINMGCSVTKALKHNYGVSLMGDPDYAAQIVSIAKSATDLPISVKLRAGLQNDSEKLIHFVKKLESAGADWITLHPRSAEQLRRGNADWSQISLLKSELKIPVIGNGDIQTCDDVFEMLRITNCDLVMAGRALAARPWLIWQVADRLQQSCDIRNSDPSNQLIGVGKSDHVGGGVLTGGHPLSDRHTLRRPPISKAEEGSEYGIVLLKLIDLMQIYFGKNLALRKFRFYVRTTSVWLDFGHELMAITTRTDDFSQMKDLISQFFSKEILMNPKTELRQ